MELQQSQRFEFGKNWQRFLSVLDDERIAEAEKSLCAMLEMETLSGKTFLDIGSGSGLFSLAAMRLGAAKVHSFDCDPQSAACTLELKRRYCPGADCWTIEEGSVLDAVYLAGLGQFDIAYSWGVLHHTGDMWRALENVTPLVNSGGTLYIAIYNHQGGKSLRWRTVKSFYNSGKLWQFLIIAAFVPYFVLGGLAADIVRWNDPLRRYHDYKKSRGMSVVHDWVDWLGGYPFEFAKPEQVFDFCRKRGFILAKLKTCGGGLGNNEFVFRRLGE